MVEDERFGRALLSHWHLDPDWAHLNHGSFGACPRRILAAQDRWREQMERSLVHFMVDQLPEALDAARRPLAALLNADAEGLAFVTNATEGINAVLRSLELGASDRVVTTSWSYGAVDETLTYVCQRAGAELERVHLPFPFDDPAVLVEAVGSRLRGARLLVIDHIASATGVVLPIQSLMEAARDAGVPVLLDGAHAPGQVPVDLAKLEPDYWVGNLHKWCFAPKGCAVLWVADRHRDSVHPTVISHGYRKGYLEEFDWVGTRDPTAWLTAPDAVAFTETLREQGAHVYRSALVDQIIASAEQEWGVSATAPRDSFAYMVSFPWPFPAEPTLERAKEIHDRLFEAHRVEVPIILHDQQLFTRISAQVYMGMDDVNRLLRAVGPSGWKP